MHTRLTARERQIFDLIVEGNSTKQIKTTLGLAKSTIRRYYRSIFKKRFVTSKTELILKYFNEDRNEVKKR